MILSARSAGSYLPRTSLMAAGLVSLAVGLLPFQPARAQSAMATSITAGKSEPGPHPADRPGAQGGWELVWSDDFDGTGLDRSRWTPEESCWGGGNYELQCYADRPENIKVADGHLTITARRGAWTGPMFPPERTGETPSTATQPYTSGKIRTLGLHDWTYGRFSARMKLPKGQGTWPAFWMMPSEDYYGSWPLSGEIDIMEAVNLGAVCGDCGDGGREIRTQGALHYGGVWPANTFTHERVALPDESSPADSFNEYTVEWGKGVIRWFVNDEPFFEMTEQDWYTRSDAAAGRPEAPFDRPFYLILNLAVGGRLPVGQNETGVDETAFPASMQVDWVRVYQCKDDVETGLACMTQPATRP